MDEILIISYQNNQVLTSVNYYENTNFIEKEEQNFDYCTICELFIANKFLIHHCKKCNKCHYKYNKFCNFCKECYNIQLCDDTEIIKHKKKCKIYNKFICS
jgi:methionyl-tRNA synthetase